MSFCCFLLLGNIKRSACAHVRVFSLMRPAPNAPGVPGAPGAPGVPGMPGILRRTRHMQCARRTSSTSWHTQFKSWYVLTYAMYQVYYRYVYYRYITGILQVYHVGLLGLGGTRIQGQPMLEVTTLAGAWALQLCEEDPCENCWKKLQGHTKSITHSHMFSTNFDMFQNSWLTPMATAWCVKSSASWCWAVQIAAWQFRLVLASLEYHWSWIVFLKPSAWCFIHIFRSWLERHTHTYTHALGMLWETLGVLFTQENMLCLWHQMKQAQHFLPRCFNFRHSLFGPSPQQPRAGAQIPICTRESWAHQVHRSQQVSQLDFFRLISLRKVTTGPSRAKHLAAKLSSHSQQANGLIGLHGQRWWSSQKIQRLA